MTGAFYVLWQSLPTFPPEPLRHCGTCGDTRRFQSSGKIRLNANGHRLDAWLIYRCATCARRWNRPLLERVPVQAVDAPTLAALQESDPAWVAAQAFDLTGLRRQCQQIHHPPGLDVQKPPAPAPMPPLRQLRLEVAAPVPTGHRLDRVLAQEWGLSRNRLSRLAQIGALTIDGAGRNRLRRPLAGTVTVQLDLDRLSQADRDRVCRGLFAG